MPRPGYILCAASGALDQYTSAVSLFGIVETIIFENVQGVPGVVQTIHQVSVRAVALWWREETDTDEIEYQYQLIAHYPQREEPVILAEFTPFRFTQPVHRLFVPEMGFPQHFAPGVLRIEGRLRRADEEEWRWSHSCEILIQQGAVPPIPPPPP